MQHKTTEELITKIIACTALGLAGFSQAGCDISTLKKQKLSSQYDAGMHRGAPGNYQNEPNVFIRPGQGAPDLRGGSRSRTKYSPVSTVCRFYYIK
jgi:hypothetical protein